TQAITELEHRVAQLKAELNSGKRIEFEKVGFLFNDESGQIKFIQDTRNNLLKSSFGLTAVTLQPVNNSSANAFSIPEYNSIKLPKQTTSTTKNTIQKNTANRVISINPKWAVAALTIPAIVAFGWWMRNNKVLDKNINMAGFSVAENTYQPINYNWEENTTAPAVTIPDTAGIYSLKLTELPNVKPLIVKVEAKADSLLVKKPTIEKIKTAVFGIIGGCFSNIENAQNFTQQLITEGYSAKIAGVSPNGLNRVVFGQYKSRTEAVWWLAQIKQKYPNAWITEIK
ncbi:MAG: SPOR domain-containing protein, partial [Bacteroidia bacterium]|nr:SPOR domain-containing protein [Bacteroidia bacterium]